MLARVFASRGFLLAGSVVVFTLSAALFGTQVWEVVHAGARRAEVIVGQEETVSLLIIALGAILQGRSSMVSWLVNSGAADEAREERLSEICDYHGFFILQVGMFVEIVDQVGDYYEAYPKLILAAEFLVNYPLNLWALFMLGAVSWKLARVQQHHAFA